MSKRHTGDHVSESLSLLTTMEPVIVTAGRASGSPARSSAVWAASLAKLINDAYISYPFALLPLFVARFELSLTAVGLLTALLSTSSMLVQPFFGFLADRRPTRMFVVLSPALTIVSMSLIIVAPSYGALAILTILGGLGTASFNPQAAALVSAHAASRPSLGLAILTSAGQVGRALGPIVITALVAGVGATAAWLSLVPVPILLASTLMLIPRVAPGRRRSPPRFSGRRGLVLVITGLCLLVAIRALTLSTYSTFLPIVLSEVGFSLPMVGIALGALQLSGAIGGFVGGFASHWTGYRSVIIFGLLVPVLPLWFIPGASGSLVLALIIVAGMTLMVSVAVNVSFALELWPKRGALVSGIMIGLGWGLGGALAGLFGVLADNVGLDVALRVSDLVLLLGIPIALLLPAEAGRSADGVRDDQSSGRTALVTGPAGVETIRR